jgi:Family of unknown function (DUF5761)
MASLEGTSSGSSDDQFNLAFNSNFNEQFNRDYVKQQELLAKNPRFLRTRQSIEAERKDNIGAQFDLAPYPMWQENTLRPTTISKKAFGGQTTECNMLNQMFMSAENIEHLQTRVRYAVWMASNKQHVIARQSDTELIVIMRSMYFTYGKNLPTSIKQQIQDLNDLVVQEAVSKILSQIQQHIGYLYHRSTQPMPLSLPQSMSTIGTRQLPSVTSLFYT